jgi:hypothetical protein
VRILAQLPGRGASWSRSGLPNLSQLVQKCIYFIVIVILYDVVIVSQIACCKSSIGRPLGGPGPKAGLRGSNMLF